MKNKKELLSLDIHQVKMYSAKHFMESVAVQTKYRVFKRNIKSQY